MSEFRVHPSHFCQVKYCVRYPVICGLPTAVSIANVAPVPVVEVV